jgi:hypothetical protein
VGRSKKAVRTQVRASVHVATVYNSLNSVPSVETMTASRGYPKEEA